MRIFGSVGLPGVLGVEMRVDIAPELSENGAPNKNRVLHHGLGCN
jgi:hypothetical protein